MILDGWLGLLIRLILSTGPILVVIGVALWIASNWIRRESFGRAGPMLVEIGLVLFVIDLVV